MFCYEQTRLPGVLLCIREERRDDRGSFQELYRASQLRGICPDFTDFLQGNLSYSNPGVLRGLHEAPYYKLVAVLSGRVQQVVVDCRPNSPTFGEHVSLLLGRGHNLPTISVFIPPGCANGFCVLGDEEAIYQYLVGDEYRPNAERTIAYNDQNLNIEWLVSAPILSERDTALASSFRDIFSGVF